MMYARVVALSAAGFILVAGAMLPSRAPGQSGSAPQPTEAAASPIGKIVTATGSVTIEHTKAVIVQAKLGSAAGQARLGDFVYSGDLVSTGPDGAIGITFTDGTAFNISSNARMELNEYVYDPKGKSNKSFFSLSKGTFTFIAGKVAKTGDMKIDTPVATMGIRGTAAHVEIAAEGAVAFTTLLEDQKTKTREGLKQLHAQGAAAQQSPIEIVLRNLALCNGLDRAGGPDAQIKGCTALMEGNEQPPQALALALNNRGSAHMTKGDFEHAIEDFDESIKLAEQSAKAFYNRGLAYKKKGEYERALADLDQAIRLDPYYAGAIALRAQTHENRGAYELALKDYDQAIRLQPGRASTLNGRCWTRAIVGELQAAVADCNESLRLTGDVPSTLDSRGLTFLKMRQWDAAIADYDAALRLHPQLAGSLYGRGFARLKQGDTAAGNADISAARSLQAKIGEEFARYGVQ
jgi:tetratricopeptide (TPR) repeat protein